MKDAVPDSEPGTEVPEQTAANDRNDRAPLRRPDPEKIAQGDEATEREKERARRDVTEGDPTPDEPEEERADRMAKRGLETRPSIFP